MISQLTSLAPLTAQLFPTSANPDPAHPLDALRSAFINTLLPLPSESCNTISDKV